MPPAALEHANVTVSDPHATSKWLCDVFGWHVRWQGEAIYGGFTAHVGSANSYLAIYSIGHAIEQQSRSSYHTRGGLNHIGIVVDDLDAVEARVKAAGFKPASHADYEPGRRFYFQDHDGIEFEVISYA